MTETNTMRPAVGTRTTSTRILILVGATAVAVVVNAAIATAARALGASPEFQPLTRPPTSP